MIWIFTRRYIVAWIVIVIGLTTSNSSWAQVITVTANISPSTNLCSGSTVSLTFSTTGVFTGGNKFTLQRSDANGGFGAPVDMASINSSPASATTLTISGSLGAVTYGTGYQFRVVSSAPGRISNETTPVTIGTNVPLVPGPGSYTFCQNSGTQPITATGTTIEWYTSSAAAAPVVATGSTYNVPTSGSATYYVTQTVNGCKSAKEDVQVSVSAPATAPTASSPAAYCPGAGQPLTTTPTGSGVANTIQWASSTGTQIGATIPAPQTTGTYTFQ